jgi:uncharacterized protein (TIGR02145 family)
MKKIITTVAVLLLTCTLAISTASAQAPEKMSYQAVVRNSSGALLPSSVVGMKISILQGSASGTPVYVETQTPSTNANGLVSLEIGSGTALSGTFAGINWAAGPYFIKTETDPTGGTAYTIGGTNELMSVPYALFSANGPAGAPGVDGVDGLDGTNGIDGAVGATGTNGTNGIDGNNGATGATGAPGLDGTNGTNGIDGIDGAVGATGTNGTNGIDGAVGATGTNGTNGVDGAVGATGTFQTGTAAGEMIYWNGTAWVAVTPTINEGATLQMIGGVPTWTGGIVPPPSVTSLTGRIWMDRNLGASQVATSSTDAASYGDLYQWGRLTDGHQIITSATNGVRSVGDVPGHGDFITANSQPYDWRTTTNFNLWQGVNGINNPCPAGYRIPTTAELEAERLSWSSNDAAGAFSALKLTLPGYRDYGSGSIIGSGTTGNYWSSDQTSFSTAYGSVLSIESTGAYTDGVADRVTGRSVRCIKD